MSFPTNPTNGQTASVNGKSYVYNAAKDSWSVAVTTGSVPGSLITPSGTVAGNLNTTGNLVVSYNANISGNVTADSVLTDNFLYANGNPLLSSSATTYANANLLPLNASPGTIAYVTGTNRLYVYNSGWYTIAAVNQTPTFSDTPGTTVNLGENANSYSYTLVASDPEGVPLTYDFTVVSGLNANLASINSSTGVFTADFTSISDAQITFTASDGVNIASATSTFYYLDPNFEYNTLLLKAVGSNTQANSTFIDSSTNNFTVTRNGDVTQGSFTPFYGNGYYSNYFDGTGDYLSFTPDSSFAFGTGNFTVECWYYPTAAVTSEYLIDNRNASQLATWVLTYNWTGSNSGTLYWYNGSTALAQASGSTVVNSWNHIAYVRSGTTGSLYINGTRVATQTDNTNYSNTPLSSTIGNRYTNTGGDQYAKGYLSNFRVVKGTAVYDPTQSTITIPSTPLSAISGTSLLTCQSNRFVDNSTNNFTISNFADVKVTTFGPFNPPTPYSASTIGGSLYFDGTGDSLSMSYNAAFTSASGDFTVEQWVYPQRTNSNVYIISGIWDSAAPAPQSWVQFINGSGKYSLFVDNSSGGTDTTIFTSNATIPNNAWTHIAFSRSGSTWRLFINGILDSTTTNSLTLNTGSNPYVVGHFSNPGATDNPFRGYISNHRIVKGTAVYTANFTPSTTPLTAIANTSFLLLGTNAGIVDASGKSNLATFGNAQVSANVFKFSKSMYFDGNGDYLLIPSATVNTYYQFGTGDFTVETWVRFSALDGNKCIVDAWVSGQSTSWQLYYSSSTSKIRWYVGSTTVVESTTTPVTNTWYHVAVARSGTTIKLFINGTVEATTNSHSTNYNYLAPLAVGVQYSTLTNYLNGYIEDLRITDGYARYTANFTPPTSTFLTR